MRCGPSRSPPVRPMLNQHWRDVSPHAFHPLHRAALVCAMCRATAVGSAQMPCSCCPGTQAPDQ
eukprot:4532043-Alexandrium_andersonii.AAC.1